MVPTGSTSAAPLSPEIPTRQERADVSSAGTYTDSYSNVHNVVDFANSLVGNNAGADLAAAPVGTPDANGNLAGTPTAPIDAKLGPLADNGGPTETCALLSGSPALNLGSNPGNLPTDRAAPASCARVGGATDIGAYQVQSVVTAISPAKGPATGATHVTITGVGFTDATAVNFGSAAATFFTIDSDTQITAVSPAGKGVVDVTVVAAGRTSATSSADQFATHRW